MMLCTVLQTAVYRPRGRQLYRIPPLPPHRGGRWLDSLSTRAYNECFLKVCEDFTITEKAPSRGLLRDYKPLDGPFSSSTGYSEYSVETGLQKLHTPRELFGSDIRLLNTFSQVCYLGQP